MLSKNTQLDFEISDFVNVYAPVKITHGSNFRITRKYLNSLQGHNKRLIHNLEYRVKAKNEGDNRFVRDIYGGIWNARSIPPQLLDSLNAHEICILYAGTYKRKFEYKGPFVIRSNDFHKEPRIIYREKPFDESKIKRKGILDKSLYEIVKYLFEADGIENIFKRYCKQWHELKQVENPDTRTKEIIEANPYNPDTLKARMDFIEEKYPEVVDKFKEILAEPFMPERIYIPGDFNIAPKIINEDGFIAPRKTRGYKGKFHWRIDEYINFIWRQFYEKEQKLQFVQTIKYPS